MPWLQLRVNSSRTLAPQLEDALLVCGALAVTLQDNADQPIFEPALGETPLWQDTRVTGLFEADIDTESTLNELQQSLSAGAEEKLDAHWHQIEDRDWEREWMAHYQPIECAKNLWICPSWAEPPQPEAVNLMLDPGLAFGTGTHPTTFLCLQWLASQKMSGQTVIDYGCGSGILGIAALLLGAKKAIGVDIDPQALLASQENLARNNLVKDSFPVYFPDACPNHQAQTVLANILAGPLVELAEALCERLQPGGKLCLSGVLATQLSSIEQAYRPWVSIDNVKQKEEWICIIATKK
ncbi:[LSU ribosomal protein L11P]-lysine N-methyltransferase [Alteromonadaceae bacterium Bs31]|nr:[LSU ribosomal protein L11P]-lysine N-methyltransferase [Alteromonadaceae bacterium Bs31]